MPPPRRRGMSQTVPGAVDVELEDGTVVAMTPDVADVMLPPEPLGGLGASAPLAWGGGQGVPMGQGPVDVGRMNELLNAPRVMTDAAPVDPLAQFRPAGFSEAHRTQAPAMQRAPAGEAGKTPPPAGTQAGTNGTQPTSQSQGAPVFATGGATAPGGAGGGVEDRFALLDQLTGGRISGQGGGGGPGGPRVTTTQTSSREILNPTEQQAAALGNVQQELGTIDRMQRDQLVDASEREALRLEQAAAVGKQANADLNALDAERAERRRALEGARDQYVQRVDGLTRDVAAGRIDRNRIWNDDGAAGQVAAALSIAVGGIVQGLTDAPNTALEIINAAIDRDIEEQRTNLDAQRAALGDAHSLADLASQGIDDFDAQTAAMREAKLADVRRTLEQMDAEGQPSEVRAAIQAMLTDLDKEAAQAREAGVLAQVERIQINRESVQRAGGGGGRRRGLSVSDAIRAAEFAGVPGAGGEGGEVDRQGVRALSVREQELNRVDEAIGRMENLFGESGPGVGLVGGRVPDLSLRISSFFGGPGAEGLELRRALRDTRGAFTRARTGAGMSLTEAEREADQLGLREDATVEEVRNGMRDARALVDRDRATARASVDDRSLAEYDRRLAAQGGLSRSSLRTSRRPGEE